MFSTYLRGYIYVKIHVTENLSAQAVITRWWLPDHAIWVRILVPQYCPDCISLRRPLLSITAIDRPSQVSLPTLLRSFLYRTATTKDSRPTDWPSFGRPARLFVRSARVSGHNAPTRPHKCTSELTEVSMWILCPSG